MDEEKVKEFLNYRRLAVETLNKRKFEDVADLRGHNSWYSYCVYDKVFCEKAGIGIDFLDRLVEGKEVRVGLFWKMGELKRQRYVMIDRRSREVLKMGGREIKEVWHEQEASEAEELSLSWFRKRNKRRIPRRSGNRGAKYEFFSREELSAFSGISVPCIRIAGNNGVLTMGYRGRRSHEFKIMDRRSLYVVADVHLEAWLKSIGAICTGMTYKEARKIMRTFGSNKKAIEDYVREKIKAGVLKSI